MRIQFS
jgi:chromosome segregation ATPase